MKRRYLRLVAMTLLLSLLVVTATACGTNEIREQPQVRIGFFANLTHAQALVGQATGAFEQGFGTDTRVKWMQFNAGFSEVEALLAGDLDIGYIGPGPAIGGYIKSEGDLQIIAGAVNGGAVLVGRPDLAFQTVKDLKGKRLAIPQFGNTQDLALRNLLAQNGLKSTADGGDVEILQADNTDIKTYLARGYIDAALLPEPWGARLIKEVKAKILLDYDQILRDGKYPTAVVMVRKQFLEEHPDLVEQFLRTHVELSEFIQTKPEEAKRLINQQIKQSMGKGLQPDILDAAFQRIVISVNPESEGVREFVQILVRSGYLKKRPDISQLINFDLLNEVLTARGAAMIED